MGRVVLRVLVYVAAFLGLALSVAGAATNIILGVLLLPFTVPLMALPWMTRVDQPEKAAVEDARPTDAPEDAKPN